MKVYWTQERNRIKWQTLFFLDLEIKLHYEKNRFKKNIICTIEERQENNNETVSDRKKQV